MEALTQGGCHNFVRMYSQRYVAKPVCVDGFTEVAKFLCGWIDRVALLNLFRMCFLKILVKKIVCFIFIL